MTSREGDPAGPEALYRPLHGGLNPNVNAVQMLVATRAGGVWRVTLLQNTPAQYHGRPEVAEALTAELSKLL